MKLTNDIDINDLNGIQALLKKSCAERKCVASIISLMRHS